MLRNFPIQATGLVYMQSAEPELWDAPAEQQSSPTSSRPTHWLPVSCGRILNLSGPHFSEKRTGQLGLSDFFIFHWGETKSRGEWTWLLKGRGRHRTADGKHGMCFTFKGLSWNLLYFYFCSIICLGLIKHPAYLPRLDFLSSWQLSLSYWLTQRHLPDRTFKGPVNYGLAIASETPRHRTPFPMITLGILGGIPTFQNSPPILQKKRRKNGSN